MKLKHVKLARKAIVIGVFIALIAIFSLLKLSEDVSEYFFARGLSRGYVFVVGHITDILGFSVFGVFVILAVCLLIFGIIRIIYLLKKKRRTDALSCLEKIVIAVLCVAFVYVATAGGCYNRKEMPLPKYEGEQLTSEKTAEIVRAYLTDFNEIADSLEYVDGKSVCPYTFDELADVLIDEYKRIDDDYFSSFTPHVKKAITSKLMSYTGTCGITFQPLGEAVINYETPSCYLAVTAAHELAHAKGVMRERDANLLAYYLLITSDKPYLRYCGYMYSLRYLTATLSELDFELYKEVMATYPRKAVTDRAKEDDFWLEKESWINDVSEFFNDLYLKLSGVKEGTANYSDPSHIKQDTEIIDGKPVVTVKITYSDTAKMLIFNAMSRFGITV